MPDSIYKTNVKRTRRTNTFIIARTKSRELRLELSRRGIEIPFALGSVGSIRRLPPYSDVKSLYRRVEEAYAPLQVSFPALIECYAKEEDVIALHKEILLQAQREAEIEAQKE